MEKSYTNTGLFASSFPTFIESFNPVITVFIKENIRLEHAFILGIKGGRSILAIG